MNLTIAHVIVGAMGVAALVVLTLAHTVDGNVSVPIISGIVGTLIGAGAVTAGQASGK